MLHSRIPVRPRVLLALSLGLGVLGMAVLGLLLVPAQHARAAQTTLDADNTQAAAQGAPNLDALRGQLRAARAQQGPTSSTSARPDQAGALTGRLVAGTTGVANARVVLRTYRPADNLDDRPVLTVTTSTTGTFTFANPPAPAAGYAYYVEFGPQTSNPNLVYFWDSEDLTTAQGSFGTLDIANVPLVAPANNATVSFPVTFQWQRRSRTTDDYSLFHQDLNGNSDISDPLGYVDQVTVPTWPNVRAGEPYAWAIVVDNASTGGGFGLSQPRIVTFSNAPAQATTTATASAATGTATATAPAATTGTPTPTATSGACQSGTVQVNIQNFAFVPQTVTVCQGATVRWTNLDGVQHTSTSDNGVWDSGLLGTNQSFSFTFNTPGTYPYHCTPHPFMRGTIIVVPATTATVTPTTTATAPAAVTGTATAMMMTGTPTVEATGTATAQVTAQATGTPTAMMATGTATAMMATGTATAMMMTGTPTVEATGTATAQVTAQATGTATAMIMTGTPTVEATGTATAQVTAQATGTATAMMATGSATAQATGTATPMMATGTATAQATGTATMMATGTATPTMTATAQPTRTATVQPTRTATVRPTGTPISCGSGNLCGGIVVVRAFIDFGCDGFFNRGTDYPLYGATVTATLPDGTRLVSIVDENGNAVISGVNLAATDSIQVSIDSPPLPTWVQQASYGLAACGTSPMTVTLQRSNFGLFGVAFTDFRFGLTQP